MDESESSISDVCRCCLSQPLNLNSLFESTDIIDVPKAIQEICGIDICEYNSLPNKICDECLECLKFSYSFRVRTLQSDNTLRNLIEGSIVVNEYEEKEQTTTTHDTESITDEVQYQSEQENNTYTDPECENIPKFDPTSGQCPICLKEFTHYKNLGTHVKRHFSEGKYVCPHCSKRYYTKFDFQRHLTKVHCDGVLFKCELCYKAFPNRPEWKRHLRTHDEFKSFSCFECGMLFRFKHNAEQHILHTHQKKKSFFCEQCGKGFAYACKLKVHQNSNSKCRPIVHKSFLQDDDLSEQEISV